MQAFDSRKVIEVCAPHCMHAFGSGAKPSSVMPPSHILHTRQTRPSEKKQTRTTEPENEIPELKCVQGRLVVLVSIFLSHTARALSFSNTPLNLTFISSGVPCCLAAGIVLHTPWLFAIGMRMLLHATPLPRNTDDLRPFDDSGADSEMALEHCCCWSDAKGNKYVFKKSPCSSDILLPSPRARIELVRTCACSFFLSAALCCEESNTRHQAPLSSLPLWTSLLRQGHEYDPRWKGGIAFESVLAEAKLVWKLYLNSPEGKSISKWRIAAKANKRIASVPHHIPSHATSHSQRQTSSEGAPEPMNQLHRARAHTRLHQYGAIHKNPRPRAHHTLTSTSRSCRPPHMTHAHATMDT